MGIVVNKEDSKKTDTWKVFDSLWPTADSV